MRIIEVPSTRNPNRLGTSKGEGSRFRVPAGWLGSKPEGIIEVIRREDAPVLIKMSPKSRVTEDNKGEMKLREAVQELQRTKPSPDLDEVADA